MSANPPPICGHGHAWTFRNPCSACVTQLLEPHAPELVEVLLDPDRATKYGVCRWCFHALGEPVHQQKEK